MPVTTSTFKLQLPSGIIVSDGLEEVSRREGSGLYKFNGNFYKIYNKSHSEELEDYWRKAESFGLAIPQYRFVYYYYNQAIKCYKPASKDRATHIILIMKEITGDYFQLSKDGHESKVISYVNSQTSRTKLDKLLKYLEAAKSSALTDPQGFLTDNEREPIIFIDIHFGSSSESCSSIIKAIQNKLSTMH